MRVFRSVLLIVVSVLALASSQLAAAQDFDPDNPDCHTFPDECEQLLDIYIKTSGRRVNSL